MFSDPLSPFGDRFGQPLPVPWDVLQGHLVQQDWNGIEVSGKRIGPHPQGFKRNRAAPGKRVYDQRLGAGGTTQGSWATCVSVRLVSRYSLTVVLSQLAKSAMKSNSAIREDAEILLLCGL